MICTKQFVTGTPLLSPVGLGGGGGGGGATVGSKTLDEASRQGTSQL